METEKIGEQLRTDTETLKLFKNSKGYNWEIKIIGIDMGRLVELNNKMIEEFSSDI